MYVHIYIYIYIYTVATVGIGIFRFHNLKAITGGRGLSSGINGQNVQNKQLTNSHIQLCNTADLYRRTVYIPAYADPLNIRCCSNIKTLKCRYRDISITNSCER
jgi:hypothetical protein